MSIRWLLATLFIYTTLHVTGGQIVVNGGWSPWQLDPEIDCCMYGGYEKVQRFCNNPLPENGGTLCAHSTNATNFVSQEEIWRNCTCGCFFPPCDGTTSFCANDTGRPAHCLCNHGKVVPVSWDPNTLMVCEDPSNSTDSEDEKKNRTCNAISESWELPMMIVRFFGAVWVIIWCIATIIVFIAFKICSPPERVIHFQEEFTLIIVMLLIAVPFEEIFDLAGTAPAPCIFLSIFEQYFFLVTMGFFFFEALHAYALVTFVVARNGLLRTCCNVMFPYILALLIVGVSFLIWMLTSVKEEVDTYDNYKMCHCFCDVSSAQAWTFFLPLCLLAFATGITGEAAAIEQYKELSDHDEFQRNHADISKRGVMFVMPMALLTYVFALLAVHLALEIMWICYLLCALVLGPLVFFYHTMADTIVGTAFYNKAPALPCYKPYAPKPEEEEEMKLPTPRDAKYDDFYKWVTDGRQENMAKESEDVLFTKKQMEKY